MLPPTNQLPPQVMPRFRGNYPKLPLLTVNTENQNSNYGLIKIEENSPASGTTGEDASQEEFVLVDISPNDSPRDEKTEKKLKIIEKQLIDFKEQPKRENFFQQKNIDINLSNMNNHEKKVETHENGGILNYFFSGVLCGLYYSQGIWSLGTGAFCACTAWCCCSKPTNEEKKESS